MRKHQLVLAALTAAVMVLVPLVLLALQPLSAQNQQNPPNKGIKTDDKRPFDGHAAVAQLEEHVATLTARVETLEAEGPRSNLCGTSSISHSPGDLHQRSLADLLAQVPAGEERPSTVVAAAPPDPQRTARSSAQTITPVAPGGPNSFATFPTEKAPAETGSAEPQAPQQAAARRQEVADARPQGNEGDLAQISDAARLAASRPRETEPPHERAARAAAEDPKPQLVNIKVVSHPEGGVVPRVVDIVAQTSVSGWPVVLVRSELDDECWWAQQSVGRQGQYIAARAHFGNEQSVRGSSFRMVILILGTPEEAVRFQTARQFKGIPRGIRRSKEFRFVRH